VFRRTINIKPPSLTIHTFASKRESELSGKKITVSHSTESEIVKMLDIAQKYANIIDIKPYYMYRQKHIEGNLENVGYCLSGLEYMCNIQIIEKKQTIIAFGAGAVSKFMLP